MALVKSVRGFKPQIGENSYLAENATIIGDVVIGRDCSIIPFIRNLFLLLATMSLSATTW